MGYSSTSGHYIDCIKEYGEDATSNTPSWFTFNDDIVKGKLISSVPSRAGCDEGLEKLDTIFVAKETNCLFRFVPAVPIRLSRPNALRTTVHYVHHVLF